MNGRRWVAGLLIIIVAAAAPAQHGPSCGGVDACLQALVGAAESGPGLSPRETDIADEASKWGADAVPGLVALLQDRRDGVRELAAYSLRSIERIDAQYLPALMASQRRESGWLPVAIGRIGTEEAMQFLVDELRRHPEVETQIGFAFIRAGAKSVPHLLPLFQCERLCDPRLLRAAGQILGRLDPAQERAAAVTPLLEVARDGRFAHEARLHAVAAIGDIGQQAATAVPSLLDLMRQAPQFKDAVEDAIIATRTSPAVPILLRRLPAARTGEPLTERGFDLMSPLPWEDQPEMILGTIGRLGTTARDAGVHVLAYLQSPALDERVAAADALGRIGYAEARTALQGTLWDPVDWQLSLRSAEALGRLGDPAALDELERAAAEHWYPLVREAAGQAMTWIRTGQGGVDEEEELRSRRIFGWPDVPSCDRGPRAWAGPADAPRKWTVSRNPLRVRRLQYPARTVGIGPTPETPPNREGVYEIGPGNMQVTVETFRETPRVAFEVEDGWLLGGDRGEFGGELVFRDKAGKTHMLLEENVEDIFQLGDAIVVTTGLGHMSTRGMLYRVERGQDGHWMARVWRRLPGAPRRSWLVDAQRLYVDTEGGGSILVDAEGRMQMADCARW